VTAAVDWVSELFGTRLRVLQHSTGCVLNTGLQNTDPVLLCLLLLPACLPTHPVCLCFVPLLTALLSHRMHRHVAEALRHLPPLQAASVETSNPCVHPLLNQTKAATAVAGSVAAVGEALCPLCKQPVWRPASPTRTSMFIPC
jgi:hypothetical protein